MEKFFKMLTVLVAVGALVSCADNNMPVDKKADKIHDAILSVDTHCDTPMRLTREGFDLGVRHDDGCVDFPRMKEGRLDAEFFAVYIGQGPRNDSAFAAVHQKALDIFDAIHKNVEKNSDQAEIALTADDAYRIKKIGKTVAFIGMENGYPIGKDLSNVEKFYDLGARYITLCHSSNNDICDSSTDREGPEFNGLSQFGEEVVKEMNRLGMMVDVSHLSDESFYDVIATSKAPVIASHSSCRALCQSPRNLDDDMIRALKENGGVIQICILSNYLKTPEPNPELEKKMQDLRDKYSNFEGLSAEQMDQARKEYREVRRQYRIQATPKDAVDHIDHVIQVAGIDHVGIGTDFDGGGGIQDVTDASQMKNLTIEMLNRGYTKKEIEKIWGGNVMRVLRECERIAAEGE